MSCLIVAVLGLFQLVSVVGQSDNLPQHRFLPHEIDDNDDPRLWKKRKSLIDLEFSLDILKHHITEQEELIQTWESFTTVNQEGLDIAGEYDLEGSSELFWWLRRHQEVDTLVENTFQTLHAFNMSSQPFLIRSNEYLRDVFSLSAERQGCQKGIQECLSDFVEDQAKSILRLQEVYLETASHLSIDYDRPFPLPPKDTPPITPSPPHPNYLLTLDDCYQMGLYALEKQKYNSSCQWFNLTFERIVEHREEIISQHYGLFEVYAGLSLSHNYHNQTDLGKTFYDSALQYNGSVDNTLIENFVQHYKTSINKTEVNNNEPQKNKGANDWENTVKIYNDLCRLSDLHPDLDVVTLPSNRNITKTDLKNTSSVWELLNGNDLTVCTFLNPKISEWDSQRIGIEVVSSIPPVVVLHNFLTDWECERMKNISMQMDGFWQRALVADLKTGNWVPSDYRSSHSGFLWAYVDPLVGQLERRITKLTGLDTEGSDALSMGYYPPGGHYDPHHDYNIKVEGNEYGGRIATFLYYLNDVQAGGATAFTDAVPPFAFRPRKGAAAFWYNLSGPYGSSPQKVFEYLVRENQKQINSKTWYNPPQVNILNGIWETRHAACPVLAGEKWVGNKWIREHPRNSHRYKSYYS